MASQSDRQILNGQNGSNTNVVTAAQGQPMSNQDFLGNVRTNINNLSSQVSSIATNPQSVLSSPDGNASAQVESTTTRTEIDTEVDSITLMEDCIRATKRTLAKNLEQLRENHHYFGQPYQDRLNEIVIPSDSEDEVQETPNADQGDETACQTTLKSSRSDQARSALSAAVDRQRRAEKILKETIVLRQLIFECDQVIALRNEAVLETAELAKQNLADTEALNVQIGKGIKVARKASRFKCWCIGIGVLVVLLLALVLGLSFGLIKRK